ncbi:MAG: transglutaminase-like cysteine peptidase [Alphaproteobacteria bacterium]
MIRATAAAESQTPLQLAYAVPGPSNAAGIPAYPTPFARAAFRTVNAELFPKWHDAIKRTDLQLSDASTASIAPERAGQARGVFNRIVEQVAMKSGFDRLMAANDLIDAVPYRTDQEVYGVSDYWATPVEMLAAAGGDCEDHAIAKLVALKQAGISEDKLRLVVGIDTATGKAHAMAVVELDGVAYALDGRTNRVVAWGGGKLGFKPLYAAGFHKAWIYRS